jgi:hypothetical protein
MTDLKSLAAVPPKPAVSPTKTELDVLDRLLHDHMAFYIDWAAINSHSPDYEEGYKPKFPDIVHEATQALNSLRSKQA